MSTLKGKRSHKILSFIFNSERQAKAGIGGCGGGGWGGGAELRAPSPTSKVNELKLV